MSSDFVFFYVHSDTLRSASRNSFHSLLPVKSVAPGCEDILTIPEPANVLNIVLHAIYNISCSHYDHPLHTLSAAISALLVYGVNLQEHIRPTAPLFSLFLSHAPTLPLDVYSLAAQHDLHELAVSASPHLLSFSLPSLSDEAARTIGPVYLKRLFFLHLGRTEALRRLLLPPPHPHAPTRDCDFIERRKLTRGWALATAGLAWDTRPGEWHAASRLP